MTEPERKLVPGSSGGFLGEVSLRFKLILRLLRDRRVSPLLKLLPVGALLYLFVPDLVIGPFDDAAVVWLGSVLFIELCPPDIVREHTDALRSVIDGEWREADAVSPDLPDQDRPQAGA